MDRHARVPHCSRRPRGRGLLVSLLGLAALLVLGYLVRVVWLQHQIERFGAEMSANSERLQRDLQAQAAAADRRREAAQPRMLPGSVDASRPIGSEACVAGTVAVRVENGWSQRPGPEPCRVGTPPR